MLKLAGFACTRPSTIFLCCALAVVAALLGTKDLEVNADTRAYFSEANHHLIKLREFDKTYRPNNNILFLVDTKGRDVFENDVLAAVQDLTTRAWTLPHAMQVDSLTNFPHVYSEGDDFILEDLISDPSAMSGREINHRRELAIKDPLIIHRLISKDAKTTAVNVNFLLPSRGSEAIKQINESAEQLVSEIEAAHPSIAILTTGNVVLMRTFTDAALNDILTLLPISGLAIFLFVFLILGSLREAFAIVTTALCVAGLAVGLGAWAGLQIDQSTAVAPVIIMTLAMASSLHIVTFARRQAAEEPDTEAAIASSLSHNLAPVFLTSLTTFIGFLTFNFADAPPFRDLGNLVATGIAINFLLTYALLPALLTKTGITSKMPRISSTTAALSRLVTRHAKAFVIIGPFLVMAVSLGITQIELDDDFIRYFGPKYDYRIASDFAEDNLTGLNIIEFSVPSGEPGGIYAPSYQTNLMSFVRWLKDQPKVVSAVSIVDITKRIDQLSSPMQTLLGSFRQIENSSLSIFCSMSFLCPLAKTSQTRSTLTDPQAAST